MKNYKDSDYALNKYSEGIVYKFADGVREITLNDYLQEDPGRTKEDFAKLKALSDEIYHQQVVDENRTSRLDVTINGLEETDQVATESLDVEIIRNGERQRAMEAAKLLLHSSDLTEIQKRRFVLHFFKGLSYRQIAKREGVFFTSVAESISAATVKMQKYFKNF